MRFLSGYLIGRFLIGPLICGAIALAFLIWLFH